MNPADSVEPGRRRPPTKWLLLTAGLCLLSLLAGRYTAPSAPPPQPHEPSKPVIDKAAPDNLEPVTPYGPIITRSEAEYTPELIRKASKILDGYTLSVRDVTRDKRSKKLFLVSVMGGREGTFLERNGTYVRVDSESELIAINEILAEYQFARRDFDDHQKVHSFLSEITWLQDISTSRVVGSSFGRKRMGPLESWLGGTEKQETVLRQLCEDPEFIFDDDVWTVVFNAFRWDGAVERWRVVGRHDPQANINEIWAISHTRIKPPGTFSYPVFG